MSSPDTLWPRPVTPPRPFENLDLKVIALILAIGLWSLVPDNSVPHVVRDVPVRLENIPAELALAGPFDVTVDVTVRGSVLRTRDLFAGSLSPTIDLFGAVAGAKIINLAPEDIRAPLGVTVERVEPSQLQVLLEEKVRAQVPVNPVVEGNPADGYELYDALVEPAAVEVSGPRSAIEELDAVSTEVISIAGRRQTLEREVAVTTDNALVSVAGPARVRLTLLIEETAVTSQIEGVDRRAQRAGAGGGQSGEHRRRDSRPELGADAAGPRRHPCHARRRRTGGTGRGLSPRAAGVDHFGGPRRSGRGDRADAAATGRRARLRPLSAERKRVPGARARVVTYLYRGR